MIELAEISGEEEERQDRIDIRESLMVIYELTERELDFMEHAMLLYQNSASPGQFSSDLQHSLRRSRSLIGRLLFDVPRESYTLSGKVLERWARGIVAARVSSSGD